MKKKVLCVLLCLLLAFGQTLAIFAEQVQQPATEPDQTQQTAADQQMAEMGSRARARSASALRPLHRKTKTDQQPCGCGEHNP